MKLSNILITSVASLFIIMVFFFFYIEGAKIYGDEGVNYNDMQEFNDSLTGFKDNAEKTRENMEKVKNIPGVPDTLGVLVVGGIGGISGTIDSIEIIEQLGEKTIELLPIGELQNILINIISIALMIAFFIGIFAHYIRPSDRL